MKTLKLIVVASLALASSLAARAEISARAWLETYYLNPQPAALPGAIKELAREGYFDEPGHIAVGIGFISTVFAQNPAQVDRWLGELNGLPVQEQRLIACALWQAGHPLGQDTLEHLSKFSGDRTEVTRLASAPPIAVEDTPVLSPSSMNFRWGAFLATGNKNHIIAILDSIGTNQPGLDSAARAALARDAVEHPRVMEICRDELARAPQDAPSELRAALLDVTQSHPRS
jgi:hypothetical protein